MKIFSIATLALSLASTAQCFTMPRLNVADLIVEATRLRTRLEILEGVGLPIDTDILPAGERFTNFFELSGKANVDVVTEVTGLTKGEGMRDLVDKEVPQTKKPGIR